ncbi:zinc ribbon domain-containing protein [Clostridium oceanicum]|uniref:Membrane-associated protein TcaA n=1 Tax=Clostridium oceanicum TaxID=1543 RepID=A0ABN1JCV6_9CLOT
MNFCTKCGQRIEENENICPRCGKNLEDNNVDVKKEDNKLVLEKEDNSTLEINKKQGSTKSSGKTLNNFYLRNKKHKKAAIILVSIIILLLIGYKGLNKYYSNPLKIVSEFENAIAKNDKAKVAKMLYCENSSLEIDKNNVDSFIKYLKDKPAYLNKVVSELKQDAGLLKTDTSKDVFNGFDSTKELSINKKGSNLVIFPAYKIKVNPYFIDLNVKCKDANITINDKKLVKTDKKEFKKQFGPYLPGKYTIKAQVKGKYVSIDDSKSIDTSTGNSDGKISVELLEDAKYVKVDSKEKNAELFINGKDTKTKVCNAGEIGPVDEDTKFYAILKNDKGTFKSEESTAEYGDLISLSFLGAEAISSEVEGQLTYLMNDFTSKFVQAVNNGDFSYIEKYLYKDSKLYNEDKKFVKKYHEDGISEDLLTCSLKDYTYDDKKKEGTIKTEESYNIYYKDGSKKHKQFNTKYKFKYNEKIDQYQLTEML